jgi:hypothetical protein
VSRCCAGRSRPRRGGPTSIAGWIKAELEERGLQNDPVAIDLVEPPMLFALQKAGITVIDGQQLMLESRKIKTRDEISLLAHAAGMVDGAYQLVYENLRPGVRENDIVAMVTKFLYEHGSEMVEGVNAISGERCNPHPHVASDRMLRPGDPAYFDILQSYMGYRTCYYRTFVVGSASRAQIDAYARCRDLLDHAISLIRPGVTTAEVVEVWPKAQEFGFPNEELAFALQYGHGIGLNIWEKPIFSRLVSFDHPEVIEEGHGLRPRDVLARQRRLVGGPHRRGGRGHRGRLRDHLALPRRGADGHGPALLRLARPAQPGAGHRVRLQQPARVPRRSRRSGARPALDVTAGVQRRPTSGAGGDVGGQGRGDARPRDDPGQRRAGALARAQRRRSGRRHAVDGGRD